MRQAIHQRQCSFPPAQSAPSSSSFGECVKRQNPKEERKKERKTSQAKPKEEKRLTFRVGYLASVSKLMQVTPRSVHVEL